jgi:microtubule-associated protein-like 1/2
MSAKAEYNEEKVYSMQVATARFMYNDKNVVTVGGSDATLILWDVIDD